MIPFNALAYQSYETSTLNNTEFFYANGTIMPSWIEGNVLNENSNALSTATNVIIWVKSPDTNTFLPANTGTATTNTVYMGFAGTGATTQNMLLSNTITGEAPQLSPSYGEYDDGASVFNFYDNFAGTTLSSKWTVSGTDYTVNNGISITGSSSATYIQSASEYNPETEVTDFYSYVSALNTSGYYYQGYSLANFAVPQYLITDGSGAGLYYELYNHDSSGGGVADITGGSTTSYQIWSIWISTSTKESYATLNYGTATTLANEFTAETATYIVFYQTTANTQHTQWVRTRSDAPNDVMPSVSFGNINNILSASAPTPSSPTIDNGQSITLTANPSGGTPPYTYQWYTATSSGTCSTSDTAISGATSSTYTASPTSSTYYGYIVTDSASATADSPTDLVNVNSALGTPSLSSSPTLPSIQATGNTITFTASWSGGTSPYTANYLITNTITGNLVANMLFKGITGTSNSFAWTIPSADVSNIVEANVIITDSASTPETTNSIKSNTLTIGSGIAPTLTMSPTLVDAGQDYYVDGTATPTSDPVNFYYCSGSSCTPNIIINNGFSGAAYEFFVCGASGSYYTFGEVPCTAGTYRFVIEDTFQSVNSPIETYTVNSALTNSFIVSNSLINTGQTQTLTANTEGTGTSPYTYNFLVYNAIGSLVYNSLYTSDSATLQSNSFIQNSAWGIGTFTANVAITDSATSPVTTTNSLTYTVQFPLSAKVNLINPNQIYNGSNYAEINAIITTGVAPFTFNIIVYNGGSEVANSLFTTSNTNEVYTLKNALKAGTYSVNTIITSSGAQEAFSNTLIISKTAPTFILKLTNPSGTITSTLSTNDASANITSSGTFTISTQINSIQSQLAGNMYIYKLIKGVPYFLNDSIIGTNTIPANYSTTYYKSVNYALNISTYVFVFNSTGNSNYTGFTANFIINQTTNQHISSSSASNGGGGGGGGTTLNCNFPNVFNALDGTCTPPIQAFVNSTRNTSVSIITPSPSVPGSTTVEQFLISMFGASFTIKNSLGALSIPIWFIIVASLLIVTAVTYRKKERYYYYPLLGSVLIVIIYLSLSVAVYGGG